MFSFYGILTRQKKKWRHNRKRAAFQPLFFFFFEPAGVCEVSVEARVSVERDWQARPRGAVVCKQHIKARFFYNPAKHPALPLHTQHGLARSRLSHTQSSTCRPVRSSVIAINRAAVGKQHAAQSVPCFSFLRPYCDCQAKPSTHALPRPSVMLSHFPLRGISLVSHVELTKSGVE